MIIPILRLILLRAESHRESCGVTPETHPGWTLCSISTMKVLRVARADSLMAPFFQGDCARAAARAATECASLSTRAARGEELSSLRDVSPGVLEQGLCFDAFRGLLGPETKCVECTNSSGERGTPYDFVAWMGNGRWITGEAKAGSSRLLSSAEAKEWAGSLARGGDVGLVSVDAKGGSCRAYFIRAMLEEDIIEVVCLRHAGECEDGDGDGDGVGDGDGDRDGDGDGAGKSTIAVSDLRSNATLKIRQCHRAAQLNIGDVNREYGVGVQPARSADRWVHVDMVPREVGESVDTEGRDVSTWLFVVA